MLEHYTMKDMTKDHWKAQMKWGVQTARLTEVMTVRSGKEQESLNQMMDWEKQSQKTTREQQSLNQMMDWEKTSPQTTKEQKQESWLETGSGFSRAISHNAPMISDAAARCRYTQCRRRSTHPSNCNWAVKTYSMSLKGQAD
jgi:hypothetical protein